jgi:hypothetical protein
MFRNFSNNARNSFDPTMTRSSHWDPTMAGRFNNADGPSASGSQVIQAAQGQKMQTNVAINNAAAIAITFELFNWLTSATRVLNPAYATGAYAYVPLLTFEGLAATVDGNGGTIGFKSNGDLALHGNDHTPDPIPTIGCQEVAYNSFFEASSISPFQVAYFRYTVKTDAQIDNTIKWFQKTFSGGLSQNVISPRAYFKPTQFQDFVIDITVSFTIGLDSGLFLTVNTLENVRFSLFLEMWTVQGIGQA